MRPSRYRRDLQRAWDRVLAVPSEELETPWGTVEYAEKGQGPPVLVSHGIMGGHDVGLRLSDSYIGPAFHVIAPSRFGYFRSALPESASPALQADVYALLLDHLGVERAALFGCSAGATSAIQFALRHPERVTALILGMANLPGPAARRPSPLIAPLIRAAFGRQRTFWLFAVLMPRTFARLSGLPKGFEASRDEQSTIDEIGESIFPIEPKSEGAAFDALVSNPDVETYPLESISVPTMLVHAADDPLASYDAAVDAAARIPRARLVTIPRGGHTFVGAEAEVRKEVAAFIGSAVQQSTPLAVP